MEIRHYQKKTNLLIRKLPFARVVREICLDVCQRGLVPRNFDLCLNNGFYLKTEKCTLYNSDSLTKRSNVEIKCIVKPNFLHFKSRIKCY